MAIMAQSVPVDVCRKVRDHLLLEAVKRTDVENKTVTLYCVADSIHDTTKSLLNQNFTLHDITEVDINNVNKTVIDEILNHFSGECQNFTSAMSLKHQLQEYLFKQTNQNLINDDNHIEQLSSMLVGLQTMANILNQLQFYKHNSYCPRLSASQYKMIYQLHPISSLLQSIGELGGNWTKNKYYDRLNPCNCKVLNLFATH